MALNVDKGGKPPAVAQPMSRAEIEAGLKSHDRAFRERLDSRSLHCAGTGRTIATDRYHAAARRSATAGSLQYRPGTDSHRWLESPSLAKQDLVDWESLGTRSR